MEVEKDTETLADLTTDGHSDEIDFILILRVPRLVIAHDLAERGVEVEVAQVEILDHLRHRASLLHLLVPLSCKIFLAECLEPTLVILVVIVIGLVLVSVAELLKQAHRASESTVVSLIDHQVAAEFGESDGVVGTQGPTHEV